MRLLPVFTFLAAGVPADASELRPPRAVAPPPSAPIPSPRPYKPIVLESSGGFAIGGTVIHNPQRPNMTLSCDHGYMEYFVPWTRRATSLVMWHSSSTQVWQNRWDGGEGYKDMFLRRDYPVYLWDGPRVGRANWGCEAAMYVPEYRDQGNFGAWNFGPAYPRWYNDSQFPHDGADANADATVAAEAWSQAVRARYVESDTDANVRLQAQAASVAADSGRVGRDIVYLTNSAGGMRALLTATLANGTNIRGIVMYECMGSVFPNDTSLAVATATNATAAANATVTETPRPHFNVTAGRGGFGPVLVPEADFQKLARLTAIQFVWGDHRDDASSYVEQTRRMAELINGYGGNAEVLLLSRDTGLKGSSHIAFADMDNDKVAALLDDFLARNKLDSYVESD